ncbi:cAMP-regulated phosphoprotein 19 [Dissostichus eleginoides]|uniref:cAMP-regulated phosphoprotein 19 n=1 Tax=Dissostichus eleginoides TaxID=100907 RepID=A0AAD9C6G9_DISEL|nr:cAMP-regulated phosphoprotein 19 [Dissostichus eleginoides]
MLEKSQWLFECTVQEFLLVITCLETNEELERWQFDIEFDKAAKRAVPPERRPLRPSRKGQKNFDSGDYNMAKAKMKSKQLPTAAPEETEITGPR